VLSVLTDKSAEIHSEPEIHGGSQVQSLRPPQTSLQGHGEKFVGVVFCMLLRNRRIIFINAAAWSYFRFGVTAGLQAVDGAGRRILRRGAELGGRRRLRLRWQRVGAEHEIAPMAMEDPTTSASLRCSRKPPASPRCASPTLGCQPPTARPRARRRGGHRRPGGGAAIRRRSMNRSISQFAF
jgi:hypothetical protein